jgi:hypothetical protein
MQRTEPQRLKMSSNREMEKHPAAVLVIPYGFFTEYVGTQAGLIGMLGLAADQFPQWPKRVKCSDDTTVFCWDCLRIKGGRYRFREFHFLGPA